MIGMLEDLRDDKINNILTMLQTKMRCNMSRPKFLAIRRERDAAVIIQNNWRKYQVLKDRSLKHTEILNFFDKKISQIFCNFFFNSVRSTGHGKDSCSN